MKISPEKIPALSAAALFALSAARASPVTVNNFSFELDAASGPGNLVTYPVADWTAFNLVNNSDIGSQWVGGSDFTAAAAGNQYLYDNLYNNPNASTGVYQDVGALQADTDYTLTVAIGNRGDREELPGIISLINGADNTGTVLASAYGVPAAQNSWQDYSISFTTGASVSGDLTILLSVDPSLTGDGNNGSIQAAFDDVRLDASAVPEPATISLLGGSFLLGLVALRRKLRVR